MTNLRNELPIAVHVASGGNARSRVGGEVIAFDGVSAGNVQMSGATRIRGVFSSRGTGGIVLLVGYSSPLTAANASWIVNDLGEFSDDIPNGTTVHFRTVSSEDLSPVECQSLDAVYLSFYA